MLNIKLCILRFFFKNDNDTISLFPRSTSIKIEHYLLAKYFYFYFFYRFGHSVCKKENVSTKYPSRKIVGEWIIFMSEDKNCKWIMFGNGQ